MTQIIAGHAFGTNDIHGCKSQSQWIIRNLSLPLQFYEKTEPNFVVTFKNSKKQIKQISNRDLLPLIYLYLITKLLFHLDGLNANQSRRIRKK